MKNTFALVLLCMCTANISLFAQIIPCSLDPVNQVDCDTVSISPIINFSLANNAACYDINNDVTIDITVSDFTSVERLNMELKFDQDVYTFQTVTDQLLTGFTANTDFIDEGRIIINWINPSNGGLCMMDGSRIASLTFGQIGTKRCQLLLDTGCDPAQDFAVVDFKDENTNCSVPIQVVPALFPVCINCPDLGLTDLPLEDIDIQLNAPSECVSAGDNYCYEVTAENFHAVSSLELTLSFNSGVIAFSQINNGTMTFGMENINETQGDEGRLRLVWLTPNPLAAPCFLPDDILFEICFDMLGGCGDDPGLALVFSDNSPLPSVTTEITLQPCEPSATVTVEPLTFCENDLNLDIVTCGSESQEIMITPYCGVAPYEITLNGTIEICEGLAEGEPCIYNVVGQNTYEICIMDAVGNEDCEEVEFFDVDPITFEIDTIFPTCDGISSDGKLTINNITGGVPGVDPAYTIQWSNGFYNTNTICDIPEGLYSVTVTDAGGCEAIANIDLDTPPIIITPTVIDSASCLTGGLGDGLLEICVENGNPPYQIVGTLSQFDDCTQLFVNAGKDDIIIRDSRGCRDTLCFDMPSRDFYEFEFLQFSEACGECAAVQIQIGFTGFDADCQNFLPLLINDDNNQIVLGGGTLGGNIYRNDCLDPGVYRLEVSAPMGPSCPGSDCEGLFFFEVLDLPPLQIDSIVTPPGCVEDGGKIEITNVYGAEGEINYEWSTNNGSGNMACDLTGPQTYSVTISDERCSNEFEFFIPMGGMAEVTALCELVDCGSGNLFSNVVGGSGGVIEYTWLNLAGDILYEEQNVMAVPPGIYIVEASDISGACVVRDTCELISDEGVVIDTSFIEDPECFDSFDGAINISLMEGTTPYYLEWDGPNDFEFLDTLQADGDLFFPNLECGLYMLTVTDDVGCVSIANFELNCPPDFTVNVENVTGVNCLAPDSGTANVTASGGPDDTGLYEFFYSSGFSEIGPSSIGMNLTSGEQWVVVCDVPNTCCSDTIFFDIPDEDMININDDLSILTDVLCFMGSDGSALLEATGGNGPYTFLWLLDNLESDFRDDLAEGTYLIEITDADGCTNQDSIIIGQPEPLQVSLDQGNTIGISCSSDNSGQISVDVVGGTAPYTYMWDNSNSQTEEASNLTAGNYCVTVVDDNLCAETFCYKLTAAPPITLDFTLPEMPDCFGGTTCITVESGAVSGGVGNDYTFSINFGQQFPLDTCIEVNAGPYTVTVFDSTGCNTQEDFVLEQPDQIIADLGTEITVELGDSLVELSVFIDSPLNIDTIIWNQDVNCQSPLCDEVIVFPSNTSTYQVTVIDENGCFATDEIIVTLDDVRNVFAANIFAPGNNDINGEFRIVTGPGVERVNEFLIYDRWGNLMFESTEYEAGVGSEAWDGRFNGTLVPPGVYVYYANVSFIDGVISEYKGSITVVR